jgi:hypothetical protein
MLRKNIVVAILYNLLLVAFFSTSSSHEKAVLQKRDRCMTKLSNSKANPGHSLRGWWVLVVMLAILILSGQVSVYLFKQFFSADVSPGSDPPWYFIRQDFIEGICMAVGGSICLLFGAWAWHRYKPYGWMCTWMSLLWFGYRAWPAVVILLKTRHLMEVSAARRVR